MSTDNVIPIRPGALPVIPGVITPQELEAILKSVSRRVWQLGGVVKLASAAVFAEAGKSEALNGAWQSLDLALAEIDRLSREIEAARTDSPDIRRKLTTEAGTNLPKEDASRA